MEPKAIGEAGVWLGEEESIPVSLMISLIKPCWVKVKDPAGSRCMFTPRKEDKSPSSVISKISSKTCNLTFVDGRSASTKDTIIDKDHNENFSFDEETRIEVTLTITTREETLGKFLIP